MLFISGDQGGSASSPPRCLMHGFAVHTKYELAPPYPIFSPKVFLKLDGVLVVNTGDSLVAVSVDIEDNHGGFGFGLYSPRVARTMSTISSVSSPSDDQVSTDSRDLLSDKETAPTDLLGSFLPSPPSSGYRFTPKDTTNVTSPNDRESRHPGHLRERRVSSTGKENQLSKSLGSPLGPNTDSNRLDTSNRSSRSMDVYNFEAHTTTPKKEAESDSGEFIEVMSDHAGSSYRSTVRTSLSYPQGAKMQNISSASHEEINLMQQLESIDSQESTPAVVATDLDKSDPFEKPTALPRLSAARDSTSSRDNSNNRTAYSSLSLVPPEAPHPLTKTLCSPGYLKYDTGSSTCSSCVSSPIILQSDSQCFTYSVRRYIDQFGLEGPIDVEGRTAYHSFLIHMQTLLLTAQ